MHCNDNYVHVFCYVIQCRYTVNVKYLFENCCSNHQNCIIQVFLNAHEKEKFGPVLYDVFSIQETFQDEFRG